MRWYLLVSAVSLLLALPAEARREKKPVPETRGSYIDKMERRLQDWDKAILRMKSKLASGEATTHRERSMRKAVSMMEQEASNIRHELNGLRYSLHGNWFDLAQEIDVAFRGMQEEHARVAIY